MADLEQNNSQQNFVPEKKPNFWQRFKFFSPSKKGLILGLFVIGIIGIGLLVNFAVAELGVGGGGSSSSGGGSPVRENKIYFDPTNINVEIDGNQAVDLMLAVAEKDIVAVSLNIEYDPQFLEVSVDRDATDDFPVVGTEQNSSGLITIMRGRPGDSNVSNGIKGKVVKIATLQVKGLKVKNDNLLKSIDIQIAEDDGEGTLVIARSIDGKYNVVPPLPKISDFTIQTDKKSDGKWEATVDWKTNIKTKSKVFYAQKINNKNCIHDDYYVTSQFVDDNNLELHHELVLPKSGDELKDAMTYCVKIVAIDDLGRSVVVHGNFIVAQNDEQFAIKNLTAQVEDTSAIVKWNTTQGATTKIIDCQPNVGQIPFEDLSLVFTHQVGLLGLKKDTAYHCDVVSENKEGEEKSKSIDFTTLPERSADANVILKVKKDRVCDEWLYCKSAVQIVNSKNKTENLCFDIGTCVEKDTEGNCIKQVSQKPGEQNFSTKDDIKNLSGFSKVGFDWGDDEKISGHYHYNNMSLIGENINIANSNFESGSVLPWEAKENVSIAVVNSEFGKVLKISPKKITLSKYSSVQIPLGQISNKNNYIISLGMKAGGTNSKKVSIQLWTKSKEDVNPQISTIKKQIISNNWQTIVLESSQDGSQFTEGDKSGEGYLTIMVKSDEPDFEQPFYIDNVSMRPILKVADEKYSFRACRMYPSSDAKACKEVGVSGGQKNGWVGFCVEDDPKYVNQSEIDGQMCLNWWPVDILPGETDIFSSIEQAGYKDRQPLYYCLQAKGNYPYVRIFSYVGECDQCDNGSEGCNSIHKDIDIGGGEVVRECKDNGASASETNWTGDKFKKLFEDEKIPNVKESDINAIRFIVKRRSHDDWPALGTAFILNKKNNWQAGWNNTNVFETNPDCNIRTGNYFGLKVGFNDKHEWNSVTMIHCDGSSGKGGVAFEGELLLNEPCNVIAQVVTPFGENKAWSERVQKDGWTDENVLNYKYNQDYYPYGAAVVGEPVGDPTQWQEPLYIMPADKSMGFQEPYQIRAGMPYSVSSVRLINLGDFDDSDKIGQAQCIAGSAEKIGKNCKDNQDCGYNFDGNGQGLCVGVNLTDEQKSILNTNIIASSSGTFCFNGDKDGESCKNSTDCDSGLCLPRISTLDYSESNGKDRLSKLFAKSYHVWEWNNEHRRYELKDNLNWDITPSVSDKYKPQVLNIKINDKEKGDIQIYGLKSVVLKFNSQIDNNHLPLVGYRVDWGDGSPISQVNDLKVYPKTDEKDPHILFHTYECSTGECKFVPKIQIEDNWGWCNNGYGCSEDSDTWENFNGQIIINQDNSS